MHNISDYIKIIKNVIPNKLCDDIVKEYANCTQWSRAATRRSESLEIKEDKHRNCDSLSISVQESNYRQELDREVFDCVVKCMQEYNEHFGWADVDEDTGYDLLRYKTGGYYKQHVDSFILEPRLLSCSLALNNDYKGGEFYFFDRELKYTLDKGDALMFPSTFLYPHEIGEVTKGTRYSIITWFR